MSLPLKKSPGKLQFKPKRKLTKAWQQLKVLFSPTSSSAVISDLLKSTNSLKSAEERIDWFESIFLWLKKDAEKEGTYVRFRFLFQLLEKNPEWANNLTEQLNLLFGETSLLNLFLLTGYSEQNSSIQETARRIANRIFPSNSSLDFLEVARTVFTNDEEIQWFSELPTEINQKISQLILLDSCSQISESFKTSCAEAILVFATQLASLGLTIEVRQRISGNCPSESPFLKLQNSICFKQTATSEADFQTSQKQLISDCMLSISKVYEDMEVNGTSVDLVHRLEIMTAALSRIRLLTEAEANKTDVKHIHLLFTDTLESVVEDRSIFGHISQRLHLISRKIAERNGESGDHYIARSQKEKFNLFTSSMKGGVIVVAMTIAKFLFYGLHLPALPQAFAIWFVYSAGFLMMQFTGSTLATKLPSYTASKLARLMNKLQRSEQLDIFSKEVRTVAHSQAIAFLGNLVALIPISLAVDYLFFDVFDFHFISSAKAVQTIDSLHPFLSFAIPLGALTGVLLWMSSIAGGWFENWVVYHKLPNALESHRKLNRIFGKQKTLQFSGWLQQNASAMSANIALGFLFGFVPFLGFIAGIPLDSQHVTISSTSAALSFGAMPPSTDILSTIAITCLGLFFVGAMNLSVSFILALVVAARASAVHPKRFKILLKLIGRRIIGLK